jgi:hypothetical protein
MTDKPPSPHDESAWSAWARSGLDVVVRWTQENPDQAGENYQSAAHMLRSMRERLCVMRRDLDRIPAGSAGRAEAVKLLCGAVGRYARYVNLIYGGSTEALAHLYPPGSPAPCSPGKVVDGRLDVCIGVAQVAAIPPSAAVGLAAAVVLLAWMRTDLERAQTEVQRIAALADAAARGVPADALANLSTPPEGITQQLGGAVAAGVGLLFLAGAGALLYRATQ